MEKTDYLIIGASAAGISAALAIRNNDLKGSITVLTDEPFQPYFRPLIPYIITGQKDEQAIGMLGSGPYKDFELEILTNKRVKNLEPLQKIAYIEEGHSVSYHKVLFATGSRPFIPHEIQGTEAKGVYALRTLGDAKSIANRLIETKEAVMIGGGLVNLKASFALLERGIRVTLVVYSPEVLSQLMEPEDAYLIRKAIETSGLTILSGQNVRSIVSDKRGVRGVVLDSGKEIPCQMAFIGKGVRPNVEFLSDSGIKIDKGIVVDEYTQCNIPDAYAAGDVAVTFEPISGQRIVTALWTNAVEMGRCAGFNMAGLRTKYTGTFGIMNATQIANTPFVSMGTVHTKGTDYEVHKEYYKDGYCKLVFSNHGRHLIGVVLIGDISIAGLCRYLIRNKMDVSAIKRHIINRTLSYGHLMQ